MNETEKIISDLQKAKLILCNPQMLTSEMCLRIGQTITNAIDLLKEQEAVSVDTKMIDRNTVMGWLEGLTQDYWPQWYSDSEVQETAKAALKALKRLDAKKVFADRQCEVSPHRYERKGFCPECHQEVKFVLNRNYCGFCGQAVKWE